MSNQTVLRMAGDLKKASSRNDAPIWSRLAEYALKPSSSKRSVNLYKISRLSKEDDTIVVPGKVLGVGDMDHKITLCPFSISNSAASKVLKAGGRIVSHADLISQNPTGKGVVLLG